MRPASNAKNVFVSNAVKHFKFEPRGKRRIHSKPNAGEIEACRWWLSEELKFVAAEARHRARRHRGAQPAGAPGDGVIDARLPTPFTEVGSCLGDDPPVYLLRIPEQSQQRAEYSKFVQDLEGAAAWSHAQGEVAALSRIPTRSAALTSGKCCCRPSRRQQRPVQIRPPITKTRTSCRAAERARPDRTSPSAPHRPARPPPPPSHPSDQR